MTTRESANHFMQVGRKLQALEERMTQQEKVIKQYDDEVFVTSNMIIDGNIIPTDNVEFDIGASTSYIRDIYVDRSLRFDRTLSLNYGDQIAMKLTNIGDIRMNASLSVDNKPKYKIHDVSMKDESEVIEKKDLAKYLSIGDIVKADERIIYYVTEIIDRNRVKLSGKMFNTVVADVFVYPALCRFGKSLYIDGHGAVSIGGMPTGNSTDTLTVNGNMRMNGNLIVDGTVVMDNMVMNKKGLIPNMNAEYICGKSANGIGDIVLTEDKQDLSNKRFISDTDMGSNRIVNLSDPVDNGDAVNKRYVDNISCGFVVTDPVKCSTVIGINATYHDKNGTLTLNKAGHISLMRDIFDGYGDLKVGDSVLVRCQTNIRENGVYVVNNAGGDAAYIMLNRRGDFERGKKINKYVFSENGDRFGNNGFLVRLTINSTECRLFSGTDSINAGSGISKECKTLSLDVSDQFAFRGNTLTLTKVALDTLECNSLKVNTFGGLDGGGEVCLGGEINIRLDVDPEQFEIRDGRLTMSRHIAASQRLCETINGDLYFGGSMNLHDVVTDDILMKDSIYPPSRIHVTVKRSSDKIEGTDTVATYFVSNVTGDGVETDAIESNAIRYSSQHKNVYATIDITGMDTVRVYRTFDGKSFQWIETNEKHLVDMLIPRGFSKLEWKDAISLPSKPKEKIISRISKRGKSYLSGKLGIGTNAVGSMLVVSSNEPLATVIGDKYSADSSEPTLRLERIENAIADSGPILSGRSSDGESSIRFGKNIDILADSSKDGVVKIGDIRDKNSEIGRYDYRVQVDGGLYTRGDIRNNGTYLTEKNPIGGDAAILRTNTRSNGAGDSISFMFDGDQLIACPIKNGQWNRAKNIGVKNFVIDHPINPDKHLVHACLEGPSADVFYRGKSRFDVGKHVVIVELPDYFATLTEKDSETVQLTPFGKFSNLFVKWFDGNRFCVEKVSMDCDGFYWEVKAERRNTAFNAEPDRSAVGVSSMGPYSWIYQTEDNNDFTGMPSMFV